jgi:hypothetical protein
LLVGLLGQGRGHPGRLSSGRGLRPARARPGVRRSARRTRTPC